VRAPLPNPALHAALAVGLGLQILVVVLAPMQRALAVEPLSMEAIVALTAAVLVTSLLVELAALVARRTTA
jgi:hypothetical protein